MRDRGPHLRIDLDLIFDLDEAHVSGTVAVDRGEPRGFTGYAALIAVIQSIRTEESDRAQSLSPVDGTS
jgi:hypothetical protein